MTITCGMHEMWRALHELVCLGLASSGEADQFGDALTSQPSFTWTVNGTGDGNSISGGTATAGTAPGSYEVTAATGGVTSPTADFDVKGAALAPTLEDQSATVDENSANNFFSIIDGDD